MNLYRIFDKIKEFPQDIKHRYQRAKKGYSYRDLWSIDYWFMEIMPEMLTEFKKNLHGCPAQFTTNDDGAQYQDVEKGMKDWIFPCDEKEGKQLYRLNEGEVELELKENYHNKMFEIEEYKNKMKNEGFELFSKYFWN